MLHCRGQGAHLINRFEFEPKKLLKNILPVLLAAFLISGCSDKNKTDEGIALAGILGHESFYNSESFITRETVAKTLEENRLDFWLFSFSPEKQNRMEKFREQLRKIARSYKKSGKNFFMLSESDKTGTRALPVAIEKEENRAASIYFADPDNRAPDFSREETAGPAIYNVISINYSGKTNYYLDEYYSLLDRGYILGAGATAEILGPDWKINSNLRMYIVSDKKNKEDIAFSLSRRRTYISFENGTSIVFSINGNPIGSIIEDDQEEYRYNVRVNNNNERKIDKIELVTNNQGILEKTDGINSTFINREGIFRITNSFAYVYLKVYFQNGNIAFTTPIWIKKRAKMKYLIHSVKPRLIEKRRKDLISVDFVLENISSLPISDCYVSLESSESLQVPTKLVDLKIGEQKELTFTLPKDGTDDTRVTISAKHGLWDISREVTIKPRVNGKRIVFDASHTNIYAGELTRAQNLLEAKSYSVTTVTDSTFFHSYDTMKEYDLLIITSPRKSITGAQEFSKLVYSLQKYVYHGGSLILTGYDDEKTVVSTVFMNRLLKIMFSPVLYRMDRDLYHYPVYDSVNNFNGNQTIPLFSNFSLSDVIDTTGIKKIYFRNPIEIYAHNGVSEVQVGRHYSIESIVNFSKTTLIKNRTLYTPETSSAGAVYKYGHGKVALLTGINFSDYDIENLDNKKWFAKLIDYLVK